MNGTNGRPLRTGWGSRLGMLCFFALLFEAVTGLAITFASFSPLIEWGVLIHTLVGVLTLLPIAWYFWVHWLDYKHYLMSHVVFLGYLALAGMLVCAVSGVVVTLQGLLLVRMSNVWRQVHLISTFVVLATVLPHLVLVLVRLKSGAGKMARRYATQALGLTVAGLAVVAVLPALYSGTEYVNEFPEGYDFLYGEDRPFAPSLARTASGGAFDPRSLAGSETCGSSGCHEQILYEWKASAHRYSAMDAAFQKIQGIMAEQNGAESTRYCGGCHDPISLFSGTKNIGIEHLTSLSGYQEGVSCLACHAIRETDLQGNANYVVDQPSEYLWQWSEDGPRKLMRDFLIRTYPDQHNLLSKRMFKAPEYCAACHKQFIDEEVNRVGWVQLQNQYDNWKASRWFVEGHPEKTVECRECHMPLVDSDDPSSGDQADYNRGVDDGKHRSHRFVASNNLMPAVLKVEGWEEQVRLTEQWMKGEFRIPEIEEKWASGPIVSLAIETPETVSPGDEMPVRVVLTSNKVGHDFPTGPLDIIQSWVELQVTDHNGEIVFATGRLDEKNFIEPGSFLFKVEPVDQYGNLIDRHNLWEMVGVRFRRALFPGYSDTVEFNVSCPSTALMRITETEGSREESAKDYRIPAAASTGSYQIVATLNYRKVDQFLLNYMFGEDSGLSAPPIELSRATATVEIVPRTARSGSGGAPAAGGG